MDRFFVKTFGCQMNVADSERIMAILSEQGMASADEAADADVVLLNGCSVRDKAVHKLVSTLGELDVLRRKRGGNTLIGVGGCVGQLDKEKLFKRAPYLDFVFGTDTIDQLPEILYRVRHGEKHVIFTDFDKSQNYSTETKVLGFKAQAFVNIMKGCDKFCTYCVVPFTRGREKSRNMEEVVADVGRLVGLGVREVTLLGQNVNSYGKGSGLGDSFPKLLRAIDADPRCNQLKRIRFTSSHPLDFSDELINCFAPKEKGGVERLCPHLHLPVQSGSNRILRAMGRHHKIDKYYEQMDKLREVCPDVALSTDLIVGFPGEQGDDFEATITLLDKVQFDSIFAFAYSPRPGTRAAKTADDVPNDIKNSRLNILLRHQLKIAEKRYALRIGKVMEILVEGEAKNQHLTKNLAKSGSDDQMRVWMGRTPCNRVVNFVSGGVRQLLGSFVDVRITAASGLSLQGELI